MEDMFIAARYMQAIIMLALNKYLLEIGRYTNVERQAKRI